MVAKGALDNDVIFKGACYLLLLEMVSAIPSAIEACGILGAARYVVTNALRVRQLDESLAYFQQHIDKFVQLEPTEAESISAAAIELRAQQRGFQLDTGESLLFAIVEARGLNFLATGDKRAIVALEQIVQERENSGWWKGRVICLEQIFRNLIMRDEPQTVRDRVCGTPRADRALSICFSCASGSADLSSWMSALDSYIADLRSRAQILLSPA